MVIGYRRVLAINSVACFTVGASLRLLRGSGRKPAGGPHSPNDLFSLSAL